MKDVARQKYQQQQAKEYKVSKQERFNDIASTKGIICGYQGSAKYQ